MSEERIEMIDIRSLLDEGVSPEDIKTVARVMNFVIFNAVENIVYVPINTTEPIDYILAICVNEKNIYLLPSDFFPKLATIKQIEDHYDRMCDDIKSLANKTLCRAKNELNRVKC